MTIIHTANKEEMSRVAADILAAQITKKPESVLGLATGGTPLDVYKILSSMYAAGKLDFSAVKTVNLDEYVGLSAENSNSYRFYMQKNLFDHINIHPENTHIPNGAAENMQAECTAYDRLIETLGPPDIQLLGIGLNGHIGFCEPCEEFFTSTSVIQLSNSTVQANSIYYNDISLVPRQAITISVKQIMAAKQLLLIAEGREKREILHRALYGTITAKVPASLLQLHQNVTIVEATGLCS
jgi:glucosamine-6-phosphate deaminase